MTQTKDTNIPAVIFDLDGTLLNSAPDIQAATNAMLKAEDRPPLSLETIISFVGNGLPHLTRLALEASDLPMSRHEELTAKLLAHYQAQDNRQSVLYPGVIDALGDLKDRGHWMAICTNKPIAPAQHIIAQFGLSEFFDMVLGGDSLERRKPDPLPLLHLVEKSGSSAIYVGDSEVDAETASRANIPFILFTEGYRKTPVEEITHILKFHEYNQLRGVIEMMIYILDRRIGSAIPPSSARQQHRPPRPHGRRP